jgi:hypothetical protein
MNNHQELEGKNVTNKTFIFLLSTQPATFLVVTWFQSSQVGNLFSDYLKQDGFRIIGTGHTLRGRVTVPLVSLALVPSIELYCGRIPGCLIKMAGP